MRFNCDWFLNNGIKKNTRRKSNHAQRSKRTQGPSASLLRLSYSYIVLYGVIEIYLLFFIAILMYNKMTEFCGNKKITQLNKTSSVRSDRWIENLWMDGDGDDDGVAVRVNLYERRCVWHHASLLEVYVIFESDAVSMCAIYTLAHTHAYGLVAGSNRDERGEKHANDRCGCAKREHLVSYTTKMYLFFCKNVSL